MATKKRNKKYNPNKSAHFFEQKIAQIKDIIKIEEHTDGLTKQQYELIKNIITKNNLTIHNLLNEIQILYNWIFICNKMTPDIDTSEILKWIENQYLKLDYIQTKEQLMEIRNKKIIIHYQKRDLLLAFVEHMYNLICSICSRNQYALLYRDALVMTNLRTGLIATHMKRFINQEIIQEALNDCRQRIKHFKRVF